MQLAACYPFTILLCLWVLLLSVAAGCAKVVPNDAAAGVPFFDVQMLIAPLQILSEHMHMSVEAVRWLVRVRG